MNSPQHQKQHTFAKRKTEICAIGNWRHISVLSQTVAAIAEKKCVARKNNFFYIYKLNLALHRQLVAEDSSTSCCNCSLVKLSDFICSGSGIGSPRRTLAYCGKTTATADASFGTLFVVIQLSFRQFFKD